MANDDHACEGAELLETLVVQALVVCNEVEDHHYKVSPWDPVPTSELKVVDLILGKWVKRVVLLEIVVADHVWVDEQVVQGGYQ